MGHQLAIGAARQGLKTSVTSCTGWETQACHSLNPEGWQRQQESTEGTIAIAIKPENFKEKNPNIFSVGKLKVDPQVAMDTKVRLL